MVFANTPTLENEMISLRPLVKADYPLLYEVASDPILWEYHPISNGYTQEGFLRFFEEALAVGSLLVTDKINSRVIGTTRMYGYDERESSVVIGHTFLMQPYWGKGYNGFLKTLMLDYAFSIVETVIFYVVANNMRSRKALEKMGAVAGGQITRIYEGKAFPCIVYTIRRTGYRAHL